MEERLFSSVAGCSGSKCVEIFRRTEILSAEGISCVRYGSYFSLDVKIILFSSHLHVLCFPSAMKNPLLCT